MPQPADIARGRTQKDEAPGHPGGNKVVMAGPAVLSRSNTSDSLCTSRAARRQARPVTSYGICSWHALPAQHETSLISQDNGLRHTSQAAGAPLMPSASSLARSRLMP